MRETLSERLARKLVPCPDPDCQCLLWDGRLDRNGYGMISVGKRRTRVHRVAWEAKNGPIPAGLTIDHVKDRGCRHRHCGEVAHLEPVTSRENTFRGTAQSVINAAKTHCPRGHPYDAANTYKSPAGRRQCRTCKRAFRRMARITVT